MNNSKRIILSVSALLLALPPFFDGGNSFFVRGFVFILIGLALLLLIFGIKVPVAQKVAPQSVARLHTEYGASEGDIDENYSKSGCTAEQIPPTPFIKGGGHETPLHPPLTRGTNPLTSPFNKGEGSFIYNPLFYLFLYLFASLIVVFFSASIYKSATLWFENLAYALLFFIAAKMVLGKRQVDILIKIFLAVSGLLCLIGIYFYLVGSYIRLTSLFWWPNPFAGYLLFALFLGLEWLLNNNSHWNDNSAVSGKINPPTPLYKGGILPILFLSIILSSFILTGSRGAFLSFLLVLPVYVYLKKIKTSLRVPPRDEAISASCANRDCFVVSHPRGGVEETPRNDICRKIGWARLVYFLSIILFSFLLIFSINFFKNDNFSFVSHFKESGTQNDFSSGIRLNYWQGAWEMFKDRPFFGWGAGTFGTVYHLYQKDPISSGKYAHNLYLEMLSEQGIFVFAFFILFLFSVLFSLKFGKLADKLLSLLRRGGGEVSWREKQNLIHQTDATSRQTSPNPSLVRRGSFALPLFAGTFAFLIHNGVDIDWHFGANAVVFWIFLGLLYNVSRDKTPQPPFTRGVFRWLHSAYGAKMQTVVNHLHFSSTQSVEPANLKNVPIAKGDKGGFAKWILIIFPLTLIIAGLIFLYSDYNFQRGMENQGNGNLILAEKYFFKSVLLNPNPDYLRQYGIMLYSSAANSKSEELGEALRAAERAIKLGPLEALNYELRGKIYYAQGDYKKAEADFKKSIELNKFNPRLYINLALLLIKDNRQEEARAIINKIISYYPEEVVKNREGYVLKGQQETTGIEKEILYLKNLLELVNKKS